MRAGPSLLFLCGGRRVALLQCFRAALAPFEGRIIVTDTEPWSATSFFADRAVRTALCDDARAFEDDVVRICLDENVSAIMPLTCSAVAALPGIAARVAAMVVGGSRDTVATVTDKRRTSSYFRGLGLPTPDIIDPPGAGDLPLFRRLRHSEGSKGARPIFTPSELDLVIGEADQIFTRYLSGTEYSIDCYKDLSGTLRAVVPRQRLRVRSGEVEKSITCNDEALIELASRAATGLTFVGPATVQAMCVGEDHYLTEINLRYGGGVTLSIAAGMDSPRWLVSELMGREPDFGAAIRWNLGMTRYDQDVYFEGSERT